MTQTRAPIQVGGPDVSAEAAAPNHHHHNAVPCQNTAPVREQCAADWRSTPIPAARRETGNPRLHRAPVGIAAYNFREGFARGGCDALRRIWPFIPTEHRAQVQTLAADYAEVDA